MGGGPGVAASVEAGTTGGFASGDAGFAGESGGIGAPSANVQPGAEIYTNDGEKLGTVKEVAGDRFKVDARLQPDYWLSLSNVASTSDGMLTLVFGNDRLGEYKVDGPTDADAAA
jgi:hypothetical protein